MGREGTCRYCGRAVFWATVWIGRGDDKRAVNLPLDTEPDPAGRGAYLLPDGTYRMLARGQKLIHGDPAYRSHGRTRCGPRGEYMARA